MRLPSTLPIARRFVLMLGGEVLQSLFGFVLSIAMARTLSARDFGVFSLVILLGGIALTYMRALAGVPAAIHIPQGRNARQVTAQVLTFGAASVAVAAGLGGASCLLIWLWLHDSADAVPVMLSAAAYIALWSLRNFVRNVALIQRRVEITLVGDLVFTVAGIAFAVLIGSLAGITLAGIFVALAAASLCSIATILACQRRRPRLSFRRSVVRRYLALWPGLGWSAAGVTTTNLQAQGQTALVALLAGPAAYAPIAAALTLLAPLRLAAAALVNLIQPDLSAAVHRPAVRIDRLLLRSTAVLALLGIFYGLALLAVLPVLQHRLFADRFDADPMDLIVSLTLAVSLAFLLYAPPKTLLESLGAFRKLAEIAGWGVVFGLPTVWILLVETSASWSLAGLLLSEIVVLVASWRAAALFMRRDRREVYVV